MGDTLTWLGWRDPLWSTYLYYSIYLSLSVACGQGMELDRVLSKSLRERGNPAPPIFHSTSAPQVSSKLWGNPVVSALLLQWNEKKKSFEKQSFILFGRWGQVLLPNFPDVVFVITWCNSLLKEADIMYVSICSLHILEWRRSSHIWISPFSGALAREEQEWSRFRAHYSNLSVKHRQFFFFISLF